jgi:hypothetical protein
MSTHRRIQRALALTCTATALAAMPATAAAMPAQDPAGVKNSPAAPIVVREGTQTGGGDQTLALVVSGTALLVALGGAGYAGRRVHQLGQPSH